MCILGSSILLKLAISRLRNSAIDKLHPSTFYTKPLLAQIDWLWTKRRRKDEMATTTNELSRHEVTTGMAGSRLAIVDLKRFVASGVLQWRPSRCRRDAVGQSCNRQGSSVGEALETPDDRSTVGNPWTAIPDGCCIEHSSSHARRVHFLPLGSRARGPACRVRETASKQSSGERRRERRQHRAPPLKELEAHVQQIRATILGPFWSSPRIPSQPDQTAAIARNSDSQLRFSSPQQPPSPNSGRPTTTGQFSQRNCLELTTRIAKTKRICASDIQNECK
jgi:hypothetical protein